MLLGGKGKAAEGKQGKKHAVHVAIRRYQIDPGSVDELLQTVEESFVPIIKYAPGFLAYYALDSRGGTVTSVSVFEDQTGAEESNRRAADWVGQNLATMLPNPPEIISGEAGVHELNLTKLGVREVTE